MIILIGFVKKSKKPNLSRNGSRLAAARFSIFWHNLAYKLFQKLRPILSDSETSDLPLYSKKCTITIEKFRRCNQCDYDIFINLENLYKMLDIWYG